MKRMRFRRLRALTLFGSILAFACSADVGDGASLRGGDAGVTNDASADDDAGPSTGADAGSDGGTDGSADGGVVSTATVGLDARPSNTTCLAPPRPGGQGLAKGTVLPDRPTNQMTDLRRVPAPIGGWILIERNGNLEYVSDANESQALLDDADFTDFQDGNGEQGLLGLAVDPLFPNAEAPNTVRIYVYYTGDCNPCKSFVSRFVLTRDNEGVFSVSTEEVLLRVRQPATNHNGGALVFGTDNMLYISFGDGGGGNDPWCSGQNPWSPLGKVFRIDVHSAETGYVVPSDNPWYADPTSGTPHTLCNDHVGGPVATGQPDESRDEPCPETIAMGLRNPFRMSFDDVEGHLWIGDVGQNEFEEVDHFAPSDWTNQARPVNFGWPYYEATAFRTNNANSAACDRLEELNLVDQTFVDPTYYYDRSNNGGRSVAGGVVYRGTDLGLDFYGRYLFADVLSGNVWFLANPYQANAENVSGDQEDILSFSFPYGFVEDQNQEIVALVGDPTDRRIQAATPGPPLEPLLSATGCVDPSNPSQPASGLIPYGVEVPLWSDGAVKDRYVGLPDGTHVTVGADGDLVLPIGTVAVKVFRQPDGRLLETRLLVRHDDGGWAGYTYVWRADQSDADLAAAEVTIEDVGWLAPSRSQCLDCHTSAAGGSLGLELRQLNGSLLYPSTGRTANQLETWNRIGLFADGPVDLSAWPPLSSDLSRGYLHSNCSNCHRPGTPVPVDIDLRVVTPLADMGICNVSPSRDEDPLLRLLAPGEPGRSLISLRPRDLGTARMPPLGTTVVDEGSMNAIDTWISALSSCP